MKSGLNLTIFVFLFLLTAFADLRGKGPFDYFRNNWNVVGLKDYERGVRITPDNQLLLAGKDRVSISFGEPLQALSRWQTKTLLEGWLPVVLLTASANGIRYDFTIWATPLPSVSDWRQAYGWPAEGENFLTWILVKATNTGPEKAKTRVRIRHWTSKEEYARVAEVPPEPNALSDREEGRDHEFSWMLPAGESREAAVNFPFFPAAGVKNYLQEDHNTWLKRTTDYWKSLMSRGANISVPCLKATEAFLASHVCQLIALDHGEVHGGEGFYDVFYIRDGAYQVMELEEAGLMDVARRALDSYLNHQRPDGRFESQKGQLDANGQAVWVLWQHFKITGDKQWLMEVYPRMRMAADWAIAVRRETVGDPNFPGLLPAAPADGEHLWNGKNHIVGYDFWNLRGMICTADAAAALGRKKEAKGLEREIRDYREAINAAWKKTVLKHFPPSWEKDGTHWGNTEILWPVPIFEPKDDRIDALNRHVRKAHLGGYVEGIIRWGYPGLKQPAIHPYMGAYTTMNSLHRGLDEQVVEDFYWYLLHSTAAHAFPEGIFYLDRTAWHETIPHVTGAANYALLLRHMLVHEAGDELHLLAAVPDWWLEEGREIRVERAPTHFGELSFVVRGKASGVDVEWAAPARQKPRRIILHLPESRRLAGKINGIRVAYRPDQSRRWDFETVVAEYEKTASPLF